MELDKVKESVLRHYERATRCEAAGDAHGVQLSSICALEEAAKWDAMAHGNDPTHPVVTGRGRRHGLLAHELRADEVAQYEYLSEVSAGAVFTLPDVYPSAAGAALPQPILAKMHRAFGAVDLMRALGKDAETDLIESSAVARRDSVRDNMKGERERAMYASANDVTMAEAKLWLARAEKFLRELRLLA